VADETQPEMQDERTGATPMDAFPALSLSPVDALRFKSTVFHAELRDKGERPILAEERLRQLYSIDGAGWSWPGCRKIRLVWLSGEFPLESGDILGLLILWMGMVEISCFVSRATGTMPYRS